MTTKNIPQKVGSVIYTVSDNPKAYILGLNGVWYPIDVGNEYLSALKLKDLEWTV